MKPPPRVTQARSHHKPPAPDPATWQPSPGMPAPYPLADILAELPLHHTRCPLHICRCSLCGAYIYAAMPWYTTRPLLHNAPIPDDGKLHTFAWCCQHCGLSLEAYAAGHVAQ